MLCFEHDVCLAGALGCSSGVLCVPSLRPTLVGLLEIRVQRTV